MRLPEVRPYQPLRPREGVVEVLLGGVVLVGGPPVVFSDEPEQAGPLVLPDGRRPGAAHYDLLTVRVAGETLQEVPGPGLREAPEVVTVLVADVTLLTLGSPGSTRQHVAPAIQ